MKKKQRVLKRLICFTFVVVFVSGIGCGNALADLFKKKDKYQINFDERLKFYLDLKTKRFLNKMALKERLIVDLIQNITSEIESRGKSGIIYQDAGFNTIYQKSENILEEYNTEIKSIKSIVNELENLELTIQRSDDLKQKMD